MLLLLQSVGFAGFVYKRGAGGYVLDATFTTFLGQSGVI